MLNTTCSTPWNAFNRWAAIHSEYSSTPWALRALIHIFVTNNHQLKNGLEIAYIHLVCLTSLREPRTWKKPSLNPVDSSIVGHDSPRLTVQRFTLMRGTLLLMSLSSWRRLNIHITNEIIRSKMKMECHEASCILSQMPLSICTPAAEWVGVGEGREGRHSCIRIRQGVDEGWRHTLKRRKWCLYQWHLDLVFLLMATRSIKKKPPLTSPFITVWCLVVQVMRGSC